MNEDKIKNLQELIINTLVPLIDDDYALLDVPNHYNIGDNLIWEGEVNFLKQHVPHKCLYEANVINWEEDCIIDSNIILFHGGGNWGDLYRECQEMRNYVVSKYKNKKIIIFPQTVWYNNKSLLKSDCLIFENHPNIVICVRDQLSFDTLATYISKDKLRLIPDMAFFVKVPSLKHGNKQLFMVRSDSEIDHNTIRTIQGCDVRDWPSFSNIKYIEGLHIRLMKIRNEISRLLQKHSITKHLVDPAYGINFRNRRFYYVNKGINFFASYKTIYTTRLHGLILGILMGKKMFIVDNKYNKCSNFYNTWLKDFENISMYNYYDSNC